MKKVVFIIIATLIIFVGGYLIYAKIVSPLILKPPASLSTHCQYCTATVSLNGKKLGSTPLKADNVTSGEGKILLSDGVNSFEDEIILTPNTRTIVNRDLGPSLLFSAGETIWLEKSDLGETVAILSTPIGAMVKLDGAEIGKTPITTQPLSLEKHTIEVYLDNYEGRAARFEVKKGHKINLNFQLFPIPAPKDPSEIKMSEEVKEEFKILDFSTQSPVLFSDTAGWAKGASHWLKTRGGKVKAAYFIDFEGKIYDEKGELFVVNEKIDLKDKSIAYLGKIEDKGLTSKAKAAIESLKEGRKEIPKEGENLVEILETGTGWLRVRKEPSLAGEEIGKVDVGKRFTLIEEKDGWYHIKFDDKDGWVSGQYAKKVEETPKEEAPKQE